MQRDHTRLVCGRAFRAADGPVLRKNQKTVRNCDVTMRYIRTTPCPARIFCGPQAGFPGPVEAQVTRRVLLANRKLVAKREDLRLQGGTGPKTGGY
jgi:hypothetical protein